MVNTEYAFVHIPKNAGTSMRQSLMNHPNIKFFDHHVMFDDLNHYKKIYIIREPIDRFTSAFFYLKEYRKNIERNWFQTPEELVDAALNFDSRAFEYMRIHYGHHYINGSLVYTDWVFTKQTQWIIDPFKLLLFDDIDNEIESLNNSLGISINKLPKLNKSTKVNFEYSVDSINFISLLYKDDVALYNKISKNRLTTH